MTHVADRDFPIALNRRKRLACWFEWLAKIEWQTSGVFEQRNFQKINEQQRTKKKSLGRAYDHMHEDNDTRDARCPLEDGKIAKKGNS